MRVAFGRANGGALKFIIIKMSPICEKKLRCDGFLKLIAGRSAKKLPMENCQMRVGSKKNAGFEPPILVI
jgi:hypothetical protein